MKKTIDPNIYKKLTARVRKTELYSTTDLKEVVRLLRDYFKDNPPQGKLKNPANYSTIATNINNHANRNILEEKNKQEVVSARYVCDIYNHKNLSKNKSRKKIEAIKEYLKSQKKEGDSETDFRLTFELKDLGNHEYYYYYYYVSVDYNVKFGIIGFDAESNKKRWGNGAIYYLRNITKAITIQRKFSLYKIRKSSSRNEHYLYYNLHTSVVKRRLCNLKTGLYIIKSIGNNYGRND
ncbi:MAG: hypothetical protein V4665_01075 [Patescibacteria group bacterium]